MYCIPTKSCYSIHMNLSLLFNEYNIDPKVTKLIRHPLNNPDARLAIEKGFLSTYQNHQSRKIFEKCENVLVFLGTDGTCADFIGLYKVEWMVEGKDILKFLPEDYPFPEEFEQGGYYYNLVKQDTMADLEKRLVIDWGRGTKAWHQWATNEKQILEIRPEDPQRTIADYRNYEESLPNL